MSRFLSHKTFATPPFFRDSIRTPCSLSERKILSLLIRRPNLTLAELTSLSEFSQQSISRLIKGMIEKGILVASDRVATGKRGQPSLSTSIIGDYAYTFGISIMTDCVAIALVNLAGETIAETTHIPPSMSRKEVLNLIKLSFDSFTSEHNIEHTSILGAGVAISGYNLGGRSKFNTPPGLGEWALIDIDEIIAEELNLPVWVENDGNVAALGESLLGTGRDYENFAYLFIAAGIGGGIVINGEMLRGSNGNAGEIGLIVPSNMYPRPMLDLLHTMLQEKGADIEGISDMLAKFDPEQPGVTDWIEKTEPALSLVVSAIAAILDTDAIVLGGRIPRSLARMLIEKLKIYDDGRRSEPRAMPRLTISDHTGDGGVLGAAMLPLHKYFYSTV
ncbi:ROK family transcriptional regulator [Kordiimonas laminariae]|uniref:ROK family transcriptional regulator n=1 Tax=Kordiimonas laminariae TaxID=2917717 RepID=UPI00248C0661|nr:ROK family transcriptional regulator [Kordiimonas laminariae]